MQIQTYINDDTACVATLTHYQPYREARVYGDDPEPEQSMEVEFSVHVDGKEVDVNTLDAMDYLRIEAELLHEREVSE